MHVLALSSYPARMASTRFRMCAYFDALRNAGIQVTHLSWLDDDTAAVLYESGQRVRKVSGAVRGTLRSWLAVAKRVDAVWVLREAMLLGPPLVEFLASLRVPLVYDYDDALWIEPGRGWSKFQWKFDWMVRRADLCLAGSEQLAARARALHSHALVFPTVVQADSWTPAERSVSESIKIGWIGTHSTAPQLKLCRTALQRLRAEGIAYQLRIVGAGASLDLGVPAEFAPWKLDREIEDFRSLDIGLCPMFDSAWHEGKCGFKQLQMWAVGVPFVSSLVGGARDFLVHEENSLIARSESDWYTLLRRLVHDPELRAGLAKRGRTQVEARYSVEAQAPILINAFRSLK